MDVDRLMRDLTIEQLENIQTNLQSEMESKKEALREMVGRRYRDIIEASSEVRRVRDLAQQLSDSLASARSTPATAEIRHTSRDSLASIWRFICVHRLLPLVGDSRGDALTDAYALLLSEQIHKELVTEHLPPTLQQAVNTMTGRVLRTRTAVRADLRKELGELASADWLTNQLAAIALLDTSIDLDQLLNLYLDARKVYIGKLIDESSSLLNIVGELKATLQAIDQLFAQGEMARVLQAIASVGWRPVLIDSLIAVEASAFDKVMNAETEKVNRQQKERKIGKLLTQRINDKCSEWVEEVCSLVHPSVVSICDFYSKTDDIIEFLHALGEVLREDWPRICANSTIYQRLFRNVIIDKFKSLIGRDLESLEAELMKSLESRTSLAPPPLFEKRSGAKFDALLGVGISENMNKAIVTFYGGVQNVQESVAKYEKVGMESNLEAIRIAMAQNIEEILTRLSSWPSNSSETTADSCSDLSSISLSRARLCLALLHCDAGKACVALGKDGERIVRVNTRLHSAVESALGDFACHLTEQCFTADELQPYIAALLHPLNGLSISANWEKVELPEVGTVDVPVCVSAPLHEALFELTARLGHESVAHLLSKNVRKRVAKQIATIFSTTLEKFLSHSSAVPRTWIQILFDCRFLNVLLPAQDSLKRLISSVESHIDPFDLTLLEPLLNQNVRLAIQRSQLLYSCLVLEQVPSKDQQLSASYTQVVDILLRLEDAQRVPMVPRLDRTIGDDALKRIQAGRTPKNKLLANTQLAAGGTKSTPSFSSLYGKLSSSLFGGSNA